MLFTHFLRNCISTFPDTHCQTRGGSTTTHRNSFIRMCKLHDVRGRTTYISSHAKQEDLYADYQEKAAKWEETYETKAKSDTAHVRIQNYQREASVRQSKQTTQRKDRGAR